MRSDKMIAYSTSQGIFGHGLPIPPSSNSPGPSLTTYTTDPTLSDRINDRKTFLAYTSRTLCASFRVSSLAPENFQVEFKKKLNSFMKGDMVIDVEDEKGKRTKKTVKPVKVSKRKTK